MRTSLAPSLLSFLEQQMLHQFVCLMIQRLFISFYLLSGYLFASVSHALKSKPVLLFSSTLIISGARYTGT